MEEINFPNVIEALVDTGYEGYVEAEFEPIRAPEDSIHVMQLILDEAT